jgi:Ser-tRNA(Ala) deacylase AlaX
MVNLFGTGRSFSAHLNPGKSKCDYHYDRDLTDEEAQKLEAEVNAVLSRNLPVREEFVTLAEAAERVNIAKLPPDAKADPDGRIRLVLVGDYDICPCIGAHVENTGQVGAFRLVSHSFSEPDVLRLRFKLG